MTPHCTDRNSSTRVRATCESWLFHMLVGMQGQSVQCIDVHASESWLLDMLVGMQGQSAQCVNVHASITGCGVFFRPCGYGCFCKSNSTTSYHMLVGKQGQILQCIDVHAIITGCGLSLRACGYRLL